MLFPASPSRSVISALLAASWLKPRRRFNNLWLNSNDNSTNGGARPYYFYAVTGLYTIVITGGTLATPIFLPDQNLLLSVGGGAAFQTNGVPNGSQSLLNLVQGSNITLANTGGNVTITGTAAPISFEINYAAASSQILQNLIAGSGNMFPHYQDALNATNETDFVIAVSQTWSTDPQRASKVLAIWQEYVGTPA